MSAQSGRPDILAPTADHLAALAEDALSSVPDELLKPIAGLAILVEEFHDDETCEAMDLETPSDPPRLYPGVTLRAVERRTGKERGSMAQYKEWPEKLKKN